MMRVQAVGKVGLMPQGAIFLAMELGIHPSINSSSTTGRSVCRIRTGRHKSSFLLW